MTDEIEECHSCTVPLQHNNKRIRLNHYRTNSMQRSISRSSFGSSQNLSCVNEGDENTTEYRIKVVSDDTPANTPISLWHDVSLVHLDPKTENPTPYLNFVCEIPKFTRKKFEIATDEVGNPIKQDTKKGELREVRFVIVTILFLYIQMNLNLNFCCLVVQKG